MTQQTVGKVYAEALFLLAQEEHQEKQIYTELNQVTELMQNYPEWTALLDVPNLDLQERLAILQNVIGKEEGIMENFLCLLTEKRRISRIAEICDAFNQLYYQAFQIAEVFVTTAVALDNAQKSALQEKLHKKLGRSILLKESVDESLLGGMVIQYGDTRMDNSVRSRMQQFARQS